MMLKCWMQHNDWCALPCCGNFSLTAPFYESLLNNEQQQRERESEWIKHNESACKWMPCTAVRSHAQSIFYSNERSSWLISVETLWKFVVINHDFCYCHRLIHALIHTLTHTHKYRNQLNNGWNCLSCVLTVCFRSLANTLKETKKKNRKIAESIHYMHTPINNCAHRPCELLKFWYFQHNSNLILIYYNYSAKAKQLLQSQFSKNVHYKDKKINNINLQM